MIHYKVSTDFGDDEIELARKKSYEDAIGSFGDENEVHRRFNPEKGGDAGCHEAADRTFLLMENIEHYIQEHPSVILSKEAYEKVYKIVDMMHDVYQIVACAAFDKDDA